MGVRIVGTGSFLPPQRVKNDEMLSFLGPPRKPNGEPITDSWIRQRFGIIERRFDFDFREGRKKSRDEGGIFETEMAITATRAALENAQLDSDTIDGLIHVSCTPDKDPRCLQNMVELSRGLRLKPGTDLDYQNLGCAGLVKGLRNAYASIAGGLAKVVVIVASNMTSAQLVRDNYVQHRPGFDWAWLSPTVFADGAAAMVLTNRVAEGHGLLGFACQTDPAAELVRFPGGGGLNPTRGENILDHCYLMDTAAVNQAFPVYMAKNLDLFAKHAGTKELSIHNFKRIYIHQANGPLVQAFARTLNLSPEQVPMNIDRYGNTSSASTLLLLDEDRRSNVVAPGDKVLFLWIGAGAGAMYGFAAFEL